MHAFSGPFVSYVTEGSTTPLVCNRCATARKPLSKYQDPTCPECGYLLMGGRRISLTFAGGAFHPEFPPYCAYCGSPNPSDDVVLKYSVLGEKETKARSFLVPMCDSCKVIHQEFLKEANVTTIMSAGGIDAVFLPAIYAVLCYTVLFVIAWVVAWPVCALLGKDIYDILDHLLGGVHDLKDVFAIWLMGAILLAVPTVLISAIVSVIYKLICMLIPKRLRRSWDDKAIEQRNRAIREKFPGAPRADYCSPPVLIKVRDGYNVCGFSFRNEYYGLMVRDREF